MNTNKYKGKSFVVTIDRSTAERGYVLCTLNADGALTEQNKPLKRNAFMRQFGLSPEWPHAKANGRDDARPKAVASGPWLGKPSENLTKTTNHKNA